MVSTKLRGSDKPSSDGLIPSLVSDFINDDGSLVPGRDLRGMVPMFPGREPPIPSKVTGGGEHVLNTVLHPHVYQIWNWLEAEPSIKVPIFQLNKMIAQEQKDMRAAVRKAIKNIDTWVSPLLRRPCLNSSEISLLGKSSASSGYGSRDNSELQSSEADYQAANNVPVRMSPVTAKTYFNRMAEHFKPPTPIIAYFEVEEFEVSKKNQLSNIEKSPSAERIVHRKPKGPIPQPLIFNKVDIYIPKEFVPQCSRGAIHQPPMSVENFNACTSLNDAWNFGNIGTSQAAVVEKCGAASLHWPEISPFLNQHVIPSNYNYSGQAAMTCVNNPMIDNSQDFPLQTEKTFKTTDDPYAAAKDAWNSYDARFPPPQ
ncbi:unnamed protein product [Orchesella dallaii]|uniref:Uncharacterized protein n=1 Tax=Orchesella dallaii TaxID=48710 RepID=A0ABP1Q1G6_9HEXA